MTCRVFAAIMPPLSVVEELEELVEPRRAADDVLRWTLPEQWHLTTAFIEQCPDSRIDALLERLGDVAARTAAFEVELGGGGAFPEPFAARVLYLAAQRGAEELAALSRTTRAAASAVGAPPDGSRFVPHLTLARMRRPVEASRWLRIVDSFGRFSMTADALVVIRSHLGQGPGRRSRYEELARLSLA